MNKKYKLTKTTRQVNGTTLYQIKALISFGNVKKGDLGGWIEKEGNLSQDGNCWVYDNACVYGNAWIADNARVCDNACVCNNARIYNNAVVFGDACINGNAKVFGDARVRDKSLITGNARVSGNTWVTTKAYIAGNAWVSGSAVVCGDAIVSKRIKLVGGKFFHTKEKSSKIKIVNTYSSDIIGDNYETLAYEPKIEKIEEEKSVGKKVKIRLAEGTIVEGEIVE